MSDPTLPPARRSTHLDVGAGEPGTPLAGGAIPASAPKPITHKPTSRAARRATPATKPIPTFTGAASGSGAGLAAPAAAPAPQPSLSEEQPPRRKRKVAIIAMSAAIVTLLAGLGFVTASIAGNAAGGDPDAGDNGAPAGDAPAAELIEFPADTPAAAAGAGPCTIVRVLSSFENAEMVEQLAEGYNAAPRDIDGSCVTVEASRSKSGMAAEDAAASFGVYAADKRPTVWLPDSSMWLATAGADAPVGESTPVAYSDLIPAMPHSLASAIRWDEQAPTWAEVLAAGADADIWSSHGMHDVGTFKLGKTSPLVATSGAAAMLASYGVASDKLGKVTAADVQDAEVRARVHEQELATSHYMATPEHFLWHARQAETKGAAADFLSAVIVDEKSVWDYNRGIVSRDGVTRTLEEPPADPLVPIYPTDGAYVADNPVIPLAGDWVDAAEQAATADFVRFTQSAEGQSIVRSAGYRDLNRELDDEVERIGQLSTQGTKIQLASPGDVLMAAQHAFPEVRKRANVLFLLDVSGSMDEKISAKDTKLTQAKKAIEAALVHFTPGDNVGLAAFAQSPDGKLVPGQLTAVGDIGANRDEFVSDLKGIASMGDTPLYQAVDDFAKKQAAANDPDRINAIVLLSDGENDVKVPTTEMAAMNKTLEKLHHDSPVLIFTLAYGKDADVETLKAIAGATGAHYYDATDPTTLREVLGDLVTSF
ncbi:VWA domain-containing protein [Microbacterium sp. H1-D42]|uniref:VWA domain-containing protein n=1 Tax=Microbacterium sp. H1-D42 TaxID=2925844 RepID=UPI001F52E86B|nr:VWA domain-containing protein [Microbacterium sp. H1-D42]UNK71066.1 substrate-binding and VWA domain-containing protein [Microbacterium sp. H1-D42]